LKHPLSILAAMAASLCMASAGAQTPAVKSGTKAAKTSPHTAPKAAVPEAPLAAAGVDQMAAAELVLYGDYACEFEQTLAVSATPRHDGYADVRFKAQTWTMLPVLSSTGALRLEDVKGQMLLIQIANKSMLLDTRLGQRVVDACTHEKQRMANIAAQPGAGTLLQGAEPTASPAR
jgi:hypothetical protein